MLGCSVAAAPRNPPSDGDPGSPCRPPATYGAETTTARAWAQEAPLVGERPRWARWGPGLGCVWSGSGTQSPMHFRLGQFYLLVRPGPHLNILVRALCLLPLWFVFFLSFPDQHHFPCSSLSSHPRHCHLSAYLSSFFACVPFAVFPQPPGTELLHTQPFPISSSTLLKRTGFCQCCLSLDLLPSLPYVTKPTVHHLPRPGKPASPTRNLNSSPNTPSRRRQRTLPDPPPNLHTYHRLLIPRQLVTTERGPRRPQLAPATPCSSIVCCPVNIVTSHPSPVRQRTIHTIQAGDWCVSKEDPTVESTSHIRYRARRWTPRVDF